MVGDLILEGLLHLIGELVIVGIIAILVSMGLSEGQAMFVLVLGVIIVVYRWEKRRRKLLGKAIDLDLDGDGKISEEEWAAAEMGEDKQEDEKEWWSEKE
tara:strand:- start:45 stop:344 length:300 start_codon:yes stop_codon:yes gene_type:complete